MIGLKWLRILTVHSGYINFKISKTIWPLNLQNEQILGKEGTVVTDSDDVIRGWVESNEGQLHCFYSSTDTTEMSQSERMTWAGHIARICICVPCAYGASVSIWSSKIVKLYHINVKVTKDFASVCMAQGTSKLFFSVWCWNLQSPVITICTRVQWSLCVLYHQVQRSETLRSAHTVYLCVLCGSENKQRSFPYINFVMETRCVYCAVRTEPLHIIQSNFRLEPVKIPQI